ncbi:MAG: homoserine kinase [Rhodobiaceae bacterium]|nr:homoserine kinase [Rhodobiaceae bacterium]|tara:strand:+ start:2763 stop:3737 length:975 start_codon:yes stop_codon:yes gene_type:complete
MAVFTQINKAQLAEFMAHYVLPEVTGFKGIAAGVQNSNFIVETSNEKYILTIYEDTETGVNPDDLPYFLGLMQHLAAQGIKCPTPIARKNGTVLGKLVERPAALVSFLPGRGTITPKPRQCSAIGAALAELHLAGAGFNMQRANRQGPKNWRSLFEASQARADEASPGLADFMSQELARLEATWPQGLPEGVIHADLFPDNVFFERGHVSGLIDFYFACHDMLAYDLAIMLNAWCFEADVNFNITKARALLAGYQSVRPMSAAEIEALPILAAGAAMRFLTTRLYDWLNRPEKALVMPKNPVDYLRRLRFHRHVTSAADYGLES